MGQQVSNLIWGPAWKPSRQIHVNNGLIQGKCFEINEEQEVEAFLGIPFAKPPIGPMRFKVCFISMFLIKRIFRNRSPPKTGKVLGIAQNLELDVHTKMCLLKSSQYFIRKMKIAYF
jgi:hypothetical protein